MTYTMEVTSQNESVSDSIDQVIDIDMIYAIDVELKQGDAAQAKRGESASYVVSLTNRGDNADNFAIEIGDVPKDWIASSSVRKYFWSQELHKMLRWMLQSLTLLQLMSMQ